MISPSALSRSIAWRTTGRDTAKAAADALARTAGFLRSELSKRLNLYSVPQLSFAYDDSIESGIRMSKLIDEAIAADKRHPEKN
jgi:ribosome-binding factor A